MNNEKWGKLFDLANEHLDWDSRLTGTQEEAIRIAYTNLISKRKHD